MFKSTGNYCGVTLSGAKRRSINIINNTFEGVSRSGDHRLAAIDCYWNTSNVHILNNTISMCSWNAIRMHYSPNSVVDGNIISMDLTTADIGEYAILISNGKFNDSDYEWNGIQVTNNYIEVIGTNRIEYGIELYSNPVPTNKITGAKIANNTLNGYFNNGIYIDNSASDLIIDNNRISSNTSLTNGIKFDEKDYSACVLNITRNFVKASTPIYVQIASTTDIDLTISNNDLTSTLSYCIRAGSIPCNIIGNIFRGVQGSWGGNLVGFNNAIGLTTPANAFVTPTVSFANYKDGVLA